MRHLLYFFGFLEKNRVLNRDHFPHNGGKFSKTQMPSAFILCVVGGKDQFPVISLRRDSISAAKMGSLIILFLTHS